MFDKKKISGKTGLKKGDNSKIKSPDSTTSNNNKNSKNNIGLKQPIATKDLTSKGIVSKKSVDLKSNKNDILKKQNLPKDLKDTIPKEKTYDPDVFNWNKLPTQVFPEAMPFKPYQTVFFDNPIALLPMKLEIREINAGESINFSTFGNPDYGISSNESTFKKDVNKHLNIKKKTFNAKQYWIRWYPDDIQIPIPIGKITHEELEKWKRFQEYYLSTIKEISQNQKLTEAETKLQAVNQLINVCARELDHEFGAIRARQLVKNMVLNQGKLTQGGDWDFDYIDDSNNDELGDALDKVLRDGIELKTLPEKVALYAIKNSGDLVALGNPIIIDRDKTKIHLDSLLGNKWMTNFEEAVKIGMGVKIIKPEEVELISNAEWLIAVGLNNTPESRYMLEELLQRRNAAGELSIIPQDSPTNNTETSRTSYTANSSNNIIDHFEKTQFSIPTTNPSINPLEDKADSHILTDLLNFYPETLGEMEGSELQEQKEASAMSTLLWDTCTPLFRQIWMDKFFKKSDKDKHEKLIDNWYMTRRFFINHVKARGNLPVIRVGKNPYGILPVISLKNWEKFSDVAKNNENVKSYHGYEDNLDFLKDFFELLKNNYYKNSIKDVPKIEPILENNSLETLLDILKTTRMSNEVNLRVIKANEPFKMNDNSKNTNNSEPLYEPMNIVCPIIGEKDKQTYPYLENLAELDFTKIDDNTFLQNFELDKNGENSSLFQRIIYSYLETLKYFSAKLDKRIFKWMFRSYTFDELKSSAKILCKLSHEKLENLFLEVFDLLFYRLDAWISGLAYERAIAQTDKMEGPARIGAYGWIEKPGKIRKNTNNENVYIQAPSLDQANTAAVLYNASLTEETDDKPFQIDLSSNRVRKGLWYIDGLRKGHLPEELLGCLIERLIHDGQTDSNSGLDEVDIYKLRKIYPLPLQKEENPEEDEFNTFVETVINGLSFLEDDELPEILFTDEKYNENEGKDKKKKNAYDDIKRKVNDIRDAASDISMSELTYQYMKGNQARTSAWLDFAQGKIAPPEPEFLKTHRNGQIFRSKILMLVDSPQDIENNPSNNVRKMIAPITSHFCDKMIPNLSKELVTITKITYSLGEKTLEMTTNIQLNLVSDLGLLPIDVVIGGLSEINNKLEIYVFKEWRSGNINFPYDNSSTLSKLFYNLNLEFNISPELTKKIDELNSILGKAERNSNSISISPTKDIKIIGKNNLDNFDPLESMEILLLRAEMFIKRMYSLKTYLENEKDFNNNTQSLEIKIKELEQYGYHTLVAPLELSEPEKQRYLYERTDAINYLNEKIEKMAYLLNEFIDSRKIEEEKQIKLGKTIRGLETSYLKPSYLKSGKLGLTGLPSNQFIKEKQIKNKLSKFESKENKEKPSTKWISSNKIIKSWIKSLKDEIKDLNKEEQLENIISKEYLQKAISILKIATDGRKMVIFPPFILKNENGELIDWIITYNDPNEKIYRNPIENSDLIFSAKVRKPVKDMLYLLNDSEFRNVIVDKYNTIKENADESDENNHDTDYYYLSTLKQNNQNGFVNSKYFTCFLIDTWTEFAPENTGSGAITFRYDAPQSESPNAIILAVPPNISPKEILIKYKAKKKSKAKKSENTKPVPKKKKENCITKWMARDDFWGKVGRFFRFILRKIWEFIKIILRLVAKELKEYEEDKAVDMIAYTVKEAIELMQIRMVSSEQIIRNGDLSKYLPVSLFGYNLKENNSKKLFPSQSKNLMSTLSSLLVYQFQTQEAIKDKVGDLAKKVGGWF